MQLKSILLLIVIFSQLSFSSLAFAEEENSEEVVKTYFELINHHKWSDIPDLWVEYERKILVAFLNNMNNKAKMLDLYNIKSARLVDMKNIPYEYGSIYLPGYIDSLLAPQILYVAVDYNVHREDKYHINGVNYFFVVTALEDNTRKIVLSPHVPVTSIIRDGFGFGTLDEKTFYERRIQYVK